MGVEIHDLVLIHVSGKPAVYARVEAVEPDVKPGWWQVRLLFLTVPLRTGTWILERDQLEGEAFTMGGTPIRLEKVVAPDRVEAETEGTAEPDSDASGDGNVIFLKDRGK